ncbi:MAG: 50S ribosomal protein L5 [Spirochaetota bacterium]|nr:50S ribosomal protein L5 [Spirochaetota bacterium]
MARLLEKYRKEIISALQKERNYKNVMQVPKLTKIVLNIGVGKAIENKKLLDTAVEELTTITGQRAVKTISKKSISNFKLRDGMAIGCKVTLRGKRMYEFLDRLVNIALPRVRDFKGISGKAFDGRGNYSLGIKEQIIFPEINFDKVERISGMDITIVTSAKSDDEAKSLLKYFGIPFKN